MSSSEGSISGIQFRGGLSAAQTHCGLKQALAALQSAEKNAVLWFAEIMQRKLYRELGYSSIHHYASEALSFGPSRISQFIRLAEAFEQLPALKAAVTHGEIPWTTAREVARVATPATERFWIAEAKRSSRQVLERKVAAARDHARQERRSDPAQTVLGEGLLHQAETREPALAPSALRAAAQAPAAGSPPSTAQAPAAGVSLPAACELTPVRVAMEGCGMPAGVPAAPVATLAAAPPVALTFRMDGLQLARFDAIMEKLRRLGIGQPREELLLMAFAALAESAERMKESKPSAAEPFPRGKSGGGDEQGCRAGDAPEPFPRGKSGGHNERPSRAGAAPFQIIVYQCESCGRAKVVTSQGPRAISRADLERAQCDAQVLAPGEPNRSSIPPAAKRAVLARDSYRCQVKGCGSTHLLEIHHVKPRSDGGSNKAENLRVVCAACHQLLHDRGLASPLLDPSGASARTGQPPSRSTDQASG